MEEKAILFLRKGCRNGH